MYEKLKTSFDHIHVEPDLKAGTRAFLARRMSTYPGRPAPRRGLLAAALCLLFILTGFGGGYWMYFTPVSAVSIDINPSIELNINRFDRVLSVEGYNDDGNDLAAGLNVRFMGYMDAIGQVLNNEMIMEYLNRDETLSIVVSSADGKHQSEMLANIEGRMAGYSNVHCGTERYEDIADAHNHGLSFGKHQACKELQALEPDITPEDVQDWTMKEILDRIDALSGCGPEEGHHSQNRHGHGHD